MHRSVEEIKRPFPREKIVLPGIWYVYGAFESGFAHRAGDIIVILVHQEAEVPEYLDLPFVPPKPSLGECAEEGLSDGCNAGLT